MAIDPLATIDRYTHKAPVNIEAAIRACGIVLHKDADTLAPGISGQIRRIESGSYEITTTKQEHYFRQRFTMAHELGHFVLHRDIIGDGIDDDQMYRSTEAGNFYNTRIKQIHEAQANSFAATVLMPEQLVRNAVDELGVNVGSLIRRFQVSPSAMRWRLRSLGYPIDANGAVA